MSASPPYGAASAAGAARALRQRIGDTSPSLGIVLGSGLGGLAERITDAVMTIVSSAEGKTRSDA